MFPSEVTGGRVSVGRIDILVLRREREGIRPSTHPHNATQARKFTFA